LIVQFDLRTMFEHAFCMLVPLGLGVLIGLTLGWMFWRGPRRGKESR
jgi:hypothetical protein